MRWVLLVCAALVMGLSGCGGGGGNPGGGLLPAARGTVNSVSTVATLTRDQVAAAMGGGASPTYGITLYKLNYTTIDPSGSATTASGMLAVPNGAPGALPLLSYQHGTRVARSDVPSRLGNDDLLHVGYPLASGGYIVSMPDYLGLGDSSGTHPYLYAPSEAAASLDMLRASRSALLTLNVAWSRKLFLSGHSEGGHATMALHRAIEQTASAEFAVTASAPISGPYDLSGTELPFLLASPGNVGDSINNSALLTYVFLAYNPIYHLFNSLSTVITSPYDTQIPSLLSNAQSGAPFDPTVLPRPSVLLQPSFIAGLQSNPTFPTFVALQQNNVFDWKPLAPVRLIYSKGDTVVSPQNSQVAFDRMTALGASVQLVNLGDAIDHLSNRDPGIAAAKAWFDTL